MGDPRPATGSGDDKSDLAPDPGGYPSRIESVGVKLPQERLSTRDLLAKCPRSFNVDLERLVGIRERRVCSAGEDSFSLAVDAAYDCLSHSEKRPQEIEMLISCSITKFHGLESYWFEPALSLGVKEAIGASDALHFDVSNACAGMMTGVAILDDFIRRGVVRCGMVVSGEYITSISDNATRKVRTIFSKQLASLTVGDAGAAVILERAPEGSPGVVSEFATYARHSRLCIGTSCRDAPGAVMRTKPRELHDVAIRSAVPTMKKVLDRAGISSFADVDHTIPHQTSVRAIRAGTKHVRDELGAMSKNVVYNLEEFGNTASTTHFVALHRCLEQRLFDPGDRVMLIAYASGLTVGAMVFAIDDITERYGRAN